MEDSKDTIEGLQGNARNIPDMADRASEETDRALELRTRTVSANLCRKLTQRSAVSTKVNMTVKSQGIQSLKRLDARPIATTTLEAQERHERREKVTVTIIQQDPVNHRAFFLYDT